MAKSKETASEPALGSEAQRWQTADVLRDNMDVAEYKHVVLIRVYREEAPQSSSEIKRGLSCALGRMALRQFEPARIWNLRRDCTATWSR